MSGAREVMELLEREARLLTTGDFDALPDLIADKEALEARGLPDAAADPEMLRRIAELARRNARLIDAARRGLDAGQADVRDIRKGLSRATYDRDGARRPLSPNPGKLERKL